MSDRPIPKMLRPLRDVGEIKDTGYRIVMAREAKITDEQINAIWRDNASMYKQARAIEAAVRKECETNARDAERLRELLRHVRGTLHPDHQLAHEIDSALAEQEKKDDPWRGSEEA